MSSTAVPELFNRDAELALLGAVLVDPACFLSLDVSAEHFFIQRHGLIWNVFQKLSEKGVEIDFVTVTDELARQEKLDYVGGHAYLATIINNVPSSLGAQVYAAIVREYHARRRLRDLAGKMARLALDKDVEIDKELGGLLGELAGAMTVRRGADHVSRYVEELRAEVTRRSLNPGEVWGISTGFIDFDRITGGLQPGEVLMLSGDPGVGKSMFAMQAGFQMAGKGHPGAIYSLEMAGKAVVRRRASHLARIPARDMKSGKMSPDSWASFDEACRALSGLPLYMSDAVDWTTGGLRADLARLKAIYKIEWYVLDYALLLQDRAENEIEKTGLISAQVKAICRALDLAGIVIVSENKEGMDGGERKPRLKTGKALRGSGQQFYDADLLLFLTPGVQENTVVCQFGKGRELEQPKQAFELIRRTGFPAFENAASKEISLADYTR